MAAVLVHPAGFLLHATQFTRCMHTSSSDTPSTATTSAPGMPRFGAGNPNTSVRRAMPVLRSGGESNGAICRTNRKQPGQQG